MSTPWYSFGTIHMHYLFGISILNAIMWFTCLAYYSEYIIIYIATRRFRRRRLPA